MGRLEKSHRLCNPQTSPFPATVAEGTSTASTIPCPLRNSKRTAASTSGNRLCALLFFNYEQQLINNNSYPSHYGASLVAQRVKRLHAMQETWVQPLGREDPLEKEMATYFSTLAWKIPWTEEPGRLQSGSQRVADDRATSLLTPPIIMSILHSGSRLLLM